jgi:hypothetical protein
MPICWIDYKTGETTELNDDEVVAIYDELLADKRALCRENEKLLEQIAELKKVSGRAAKALRQSAATLRKSGVAIQVLQKALDEPVDHTQYCPVLPAAV